MDLQKRIEIAVGRTGKSIAELAVKLGINRSAIYQWLDGSTEPAPVNLFHLAKEAKVRPEWLLFEEGPMEPHRLAGACSELQKALEGMPDDKLDKAILELIEFAKFKRKSA